MSQVESDVQIGGVVVGEAESDPLPHAEATNKNARAIAYFLIAGSCHLPMSTAGLAGLISPTSRSDIDAHPVTNTRGRKKVPTERTTAQ